MQERFKCFSVKILDYYNITVHSLVCNELSYSVPLKKNKTQQQEKKMLVQVFKYKWE